MLRRIIRTLKRKWCGRGEFGSPMIARSAHVSRDCRIAAFVNVAAGAYITRGSEIGLRTSIGRDSKLQDAHVGRYCSISWNVTIGAPAHPLSCLTTHAFPVQKRFGIVDRDGALCRPPTAANVGNDVWIGCHAIILSGVTVGDGAVVGAASVVTHDVPPYAIVAGVPARILRYRFPPNIVGALTRICWWNLPDEVVRLAAEQGCFSGELTADVLRKMELVAGNAKCRESLQ